MSLSIKNGEADRLARQLAAATGESITRVVVRALRERMERQAAAPRGKAGTDLAKIGRALARMPVLDTRCPDELLGYDDFGLPR